MEIFGQVVITTWVLLILFTAIMVIFAEKVFKNELEIATIGLGFSWFFTVALTVLFVIIEIMLAIWQ